MAESEATTSGVAASDVTSELDTLSIQDLNIDYDYFDDALSSIENEVLFIPHVYFYCASFFH